MAGSSRKPDHSLSAIVTEWKQLNDEGGSIKMRIPSPTGWRELSLFGKEERTAIISAIEANDLKAAFGLAFEAGRIQGQAEAFYNERAQRGDINAALESDAARLWKEKRDKLKELNADFDRLLADAAAHVYKSSNGASDNLPQVEYLKLLRDALGGKQAVKSKLKSLSKGYTKRDMEYFFADHKWLELERGRKPKAK